jgi:hypothetical protein
MVEEIKGEKDTIMEEEGVEKEEDKEEITIMIIKNSEGLTNGFGTTYNIIIP